MEDQHHPEHQQLLSRRERLRAQRQAQHAAPGRIRLRLGAVVVLVAALISWLAVSWLSSATSSGETLPDIPELAAESERPVERPSAQPSPETEEAGVVMTHVAGAVQEPQVVELAPGARVGEAVDAAGGFAEDAAAEGVNLAAEAVDGSFIWVPTVEEFSSDAPAPSAAAGQHAEGQGDQPDRVNINTAGVEQLQELPGIGPALAERVLSYRETNGEFSSLEELAAVSGIGPAVIENIADDIDW